MIERERGRKDEREEKKSSKGDINTCRNSTHVTTHFPHVIPSSPRTSESFRGEKKWSGGALRFNRAGRDLLVGGQKE